VAAVEFDRDLDMAPGIATADRVFQNVLESGGEIREIVGFDEFEGFVVKILADDMEKVAKTTVSSRVKLAGVAKKASDD
jgi:hypothetical protein